MKNKHRPHRIFILIHTLLSLPATSPSPPPFSSSSSSTGLKPPPLPILPLPSAAQLSWQLRGAALFLHFGPNTFTDSEWGSGHVDPSLFHPPLLDATQWIRVAKDAGFGRVILTAKHHDGFCLWPSHYTNYSVRSSPWRNGTGDVVSDLADAARAAGIGLGLYLSPWDRHDPSYGHTLEYNEFYMGQLTELLTRYGEIKEVWLDGAKGEGERDMEYFFESWFSLIHQLQPGAVIFSDAGPDTRWIGDEAGVASSTCWSLFNRSDAMIGGTDPKYSQGGDPYGHDWVPPECDVSIRAGWFWHGSEVPKSADTLLNIFYNSAGKNCLFLLNVPPNSSGLISDEDIKVLKEFNELRSSIFSHNRAQSARVSASSTRGGGSGSGTGDSRFDPHRVLDEGIYSYWAPEEYQREWSLYLELHEPMAFNVLLVQEPIHMGQRVSGFHLDVFTDGEWREAAKGTTIGYQRLLQFPKVETDRLRFVIDGSRADPLISYFGVYLDSYSNISHTTRESNFSSGLVYHGITHNHSRIDEI